jgi:hypothetical protein
MTDVVHKPNRELSDPSQLLLGFLDYYRSVIIRKAQGLSDAELRNSRLPSGWTPLELVKHLVYMERRWLWWGYLAEPMPTPYGDENDTGRWHVGTEETPDDLFAALRAGGERTRQIVAAAELEAVAASGGRFTDTDDRPRPTLAWILTYVLQEYARHAGHLDVARELADGATGE